MTPHSPDRSVQAARQIERWLLCSDVQLSAGPHRGGIAGWLDAEGHPAFVYLEITGYYLTSMAWLLAGGARLPGAASMARERGTRAVAWLHATVRGGQLPATRIHLRATGDDDWRNRADFSFDLAMAIRGLGAFAAVTGDDDGAATVTRDVLVARLAEMRDNSPLLPSHRLRGNPTLPSRWSTRRGPHHLKAAAALLAAVSVDGLLPRAKDTWLHWADQLDRGWPASELHPLLYGLEGLAMAAETDLDSVELAFTRLMRLQRPDGSLPSGLAGNGAVRSDVLAQALRLGALLRAMGRLQAGSWLERLDRLADRLLDHIRPDGSVRFAANQVTSNAWCAMFAHQALVLHAAGDPAAAMLGRRYLV